MGKRIKRVLPAYPLFVKDPYFSIWADNERLTGGHTVFWHGEPKPMNGYVNFNGRSYLFMGESGGYGNVSELRQNYLNVTAFTTDYGFTCSDFDLKISFISPLLPDDLRVLSCPVCYLEYAVTQKNNIPLPRDFRVVFEIEERICYNTCGEIERRAETTGGILKCGGYETAYLGLLNQTPLSHCVDEAGADWGYYYLTGESCHIIKCGGRKFLRAENAAPDGRFMLGFDDVFAVNYYGELLRGYFFKDGGTIADALDFSYRNFESVKKQCAAFDADLKKRAAAYGDDYLIILYASLRQSLGAHKLAADKAERVLWLSKECNSDGCIATADVSYPSMPLFLLYNPVLLKGMLLPILDFARMFVWEYDFAPHDAGIYPLVLGQIYGAKNSDAYFHNGFEGFARLYSFLCGSDASHPLYALPRGQGIYDFNKQMPVEECGNMLIMAALLYLRDGDAGFVISNLDLYEKWADYLVRYGLIPSDQLCTDDFAGLSDRNANLAVKAIVGIKAYAILLRAVEKTGIVEQNIKKHELLAAEYAAMWAELYMGADCTILSPDFPDSYSLKYNMAADILLGILNCGKAEYGGLFAGALKEREVDKYLSVAVSYGTPLDSRADYTKSDWLLWSALLTHDLDKRKKLISSVARFLRESHGRIPFADWYEAADGSPKPFRNRTVQGGCFILLLESEV